MSKLARMVLQLKIFTQKGAAVSQSLPPRNLPLLLLQARETFMPHFRPILNYAGLTEQQWRIVRTLHEEGNLEPRDLCERCQILSPSLAGILRRMDEMGLIVRYPIPEDRRRMYIGLTEKSQQLVAELTPIITQQYAYLREAFGEELIEQLHQTLDEVLRKQQVEVQQVKLPK